MDKRAKFGLYAIGLVVLLLVVLEAAKPKPINWYDSYTASDKIPLGCYVLHQELKEVSEEMLFSNKNIVDSRDVLNTEEPATLVLINNYIYLDKEETNELLDFVEKGNNVFISSLNISGNLSDTLKFTTYNTGSQLIQHPFVNNFYNKKLAKHGIKISEVFEEAYFDRIDTVKTTALGYSYLADDDSIQRINFIKVPFGNQNGAFYLHTNPYVYSNYHMLKGTKTYAAASLSYVTDKSTLIWDEYYKAGRHEIETPMRFILQQDALKWALYLLIISLMLYIIFRGKRTQRIIPVIEPLQNHTVEFTRTIGSLYFQHRDFSNIIDKKIVFFLEYVRIHYYLDTNELNNKFIEHLTLKSGKSKDMVTDIVRYLQHLNSKTVHTEQDLIDLNTKIERFLKK